MRRLCLMVPFVVALVVSAACPAKTPPATPAQVAFAVKTYAGQVEGLLVAAGNAATAARDVVHGLPLTADQRASFDAQFAALQRAADTAITQVEQYATGTAPSLPGVHSAVQTLAGLFTPFVAAVTAMRPTDTSLAASLAAATSILNSVLALTAPTSGV